MKYIKSAWSEKMKSSMLREWAFGMCYFLTVQVYMSITMKNWRGKCSKIQSSLRKTLMSSKWMLTDLLPASYDIQCIENKKKLIKANFGDFKMSSLRSIINPYSAFLILLLTIEEILDIAKVWTFWLVSFWYFTNQKTKHFTHSLL